MENFCGKLENGKWVCYKCMGPDHTFRDKNKYTNHINNITHKKKFGEEAKTKKEIEQERNTELEERVKYLENKLEKALAEIKELKLEKQIEERIRKEQPKHIVEPALCIPHNEIIEPNKKPKLKTITDPVKYLTNKFQDNKDIIDIEQDIDNMIDSNDFSKINLGFKDLKTDIQSIFVYYTNKNSIFYINKNFYHCTEDKWKIIELYELIVRVFDYIKLIYKRDKIPFELSGVKQTFIEEIRSTVLRCCSKEYEW
jgi:uncharacterized C2H2 Zn-finger protein